MSEIGRNMSADRAGVLREVGPRFCLFFLGWLAALATIFEWWRLHWVDIYMYPICYGAVYLLNLLGLPAVLGQLYLPAATYELSLDNVVYLVTFECTGLFALFICLASILAYPAPVSVKVKGLFVVVPSFCVYSTLRLVILGLVAHIAPAHIELFHIYVMVLVNIGFVLSLWLYWIYEMVQPAESELA